MMNTALSMSMAIKDADITGALSFISRVSDGGDYKGSPSLLDITLFDYP